MGFATLLVPPLLLTRFWWLGLTLVVVTFALGAAIAIADARRIGAWLAFRRAMRRSEASMPPSTIGTPGNACRHRFA